MRHEGTVIGDRHESPGRRGVGVCAPTPSAHEAAGRSRPGILIVSRRRQVLHMNRRALELTGHLHHAERGPVNEIRSAPVRGLCAQIQEALNICKEADIWERVEMKRVIIEGGRKILVRGFGLADRQAFEDSRIVIVLEEIGLRQEHTLNRRRRGAFFLRSVAPSPENQFGSDPKAEASDAQAWDVVETASGLDRMGGVGISERELT